MKIRIDRAELAEASAWVALVLSKNPQAAVLGGIKIVAANDEVTLSGYDYDTAHTATLDAEVMGAGECIVNGRTLAQIVAGMKAATVELGLDGTRLTITAGRATYRVGTMVVDDFPALPAFPEKVGEAGATQLAQTVGMVTHASSRDPMLPVLASLGIVSTASEIAFACTDRFRLARAVVPAHDVDAGLSITVPASVIAASLKGLSNVVEIGASERLFGLRDDRRQVTTRLVDLVFPDVKRVFETMKATTLVTTDVEELAAAIKRTLVFADEKAGVFLEFVDGEIILTVDGDQGDAAEYVEATLDGPTLKARFNGRYLIDTLDAVPTERVELGLTTPHAVMRVSPIGDDRAAFAVMTRRVLA